MNSERSGQIVSVFDRHYGDFVRRDPHAFRRKFRTMAASPFAFYRGSTCLFYFDLTGELADETYLDDRTKRVWIHGDLHAQNFGTYMDSQGRLDFNVNDFDEAYIGAYIWDLKRFAASLALIGHSKALSDRVITGLVTAFAATYLTEIRAVATSASAAGAINLDTAQGPIRHVLQSARLLTRNDMLAGRTVVDDYQRRFRRNSQVFELDGPTATMVQEAYTNYLTTLPPNRAIHAQSAQIKDIMLIKGAGIGSAGFPSYNLLLEGPTEAMENDIVLYMKEAQTPAVAGYADSPAIRARFQHQGHRTAASQRALQAHADPWVGHATIDGIGYYAAEISPYEADLNWDDLTEPDDIMTVVHDLARIVARMHGAADIDADHELIEFSCEEAIATVVGSDDNGFAGGLTDFAHSYAARTRIDHQLFVDLFRNGELGVD